MQAASRRQFYAFLVLLGLLVGSCSMLSQGVNSTFYFDDHINLNALGDNGQVDSIESARQFVFGNASGRTGRPISMASFLLDDFSWPSDATSFKRTNIAIHAIIGLLVFWLVYLISYLKSKESALWVALFVAGVWLFSPLHVSTVLYPVQRMAQLSTLFAVAALILYVKARIKIDRDQWLYGVMLFSLVFLSFVFSVYSKENGAILPLMIAVTELWVSKYLVWHRLWLRYVVWGLIVAGSLVLFAVILYVSFGNGFFEVYPGRDFSPYQRLITQPEIIIFYLKELFFPALYTSGLYYDDFSPALSFFSSIRAPANFLFFSSIVITAIWLFKKGYYSGLAVCFFLTGHIIESSVLNLELIFEHRNYFPSVLLGFVWLDLFLVLKRFSKLSILVLLVPIFAYPLFLYERSILWQDEVRLGRYLAMSRPESIRAHVELNNSLLNRGLKPEAKEAIDLAIEKNPSNVYIAMHAVLVDCLIGKADDQNLDHLQSLAEVSVFDGRNRLAFEKMYQYMAQKRCEFLTPQYFSELLAAFRKQQPDPSTSSAVSKRLLSIYADRFYIEYPEYSPYGVVPLKKILESDNPEYLMSTAAHLATVAKYQEALVLSDKALGLVRSGRLGTGSKSAKSFERNIIEFQSTVRQDARE